MNKKEKVIIPDFIVEFYEGLEYHDQNEVVDIEHTLEALEEDTDHFDEDLRLFSEWVKANVETYKAFANTQSYGGTYEAGKYYAVFDGQIDGYKAGMAYESYLEAREGIMDRIYSVHTDFFESDGYDNWEEFMKEEKYTEEDLINFQGYEIHIVSEKDFETILNSDDIGLLTSVNLDS